MDTSRRFDSYLALGEIALGQSSTALRREALRWLRAAVALRPQSGQAWLLLGAAQGEAEVMHPPKEGAAQAEPEAPPVVKAATGVRAAPAHAPVHLLPLQVAPAWRKIPTGNEPARARVKVK